MGRKKQHEEDTRDMLDEVDEFADERLRFEDEESDESENEDEYQEVMGIGDEEEDDDEEDNDAEEFSDEEFEKEKDFDKKAAGGWGKSKRAYYQDDRAQKDEDADEEEEEALRLQQLQAAGFHEEDFGDSVLTASAKPLKTADTQLLRDLTKDLDAIVLPGAEASAETTTIPKSLEGLGRDEKLQALLAESPELLVLVEELQSKVSTLRLQLAPFIAKVKAGELPTNNGYCINVSFYLALKAEGVSVKDHPVIDVLVRLRTVMEKIKPLQKKLRYQIDKLLKTSVTGTVSADPSDPLRHKAQPGRLALPDGEVDDGGSGSGSGGSADEAPARKGIYRPPKLREVPYNEPGARDAHPRARPPRQRAPVMEYIRNEFGDTPVEEKQVGANVLDEPGEWKAQQAYEEDTLQRMMQSRKQKVMDRRPALVDELKELEDFTERLPAGGDDEETGHKRTLRQALNAISQEVVQQRRGTGDEDLPPRQLGPRTKRGGAEVGSELEDVEIPSDESEVEDDMDGEDEMYKEAAGAAKRQKLSKREEKQRAWDEKMDVRRRQKPASVGEGGRRKVSREIDQNRGLMKQRSKSAKTSHSKLRKKYESKVKRRRGMQPTMRDTKAPYRGEKTGIKTTVVRSTKL